MAYPIKYIENNLVWNKDGECYAYYELVPYNYSFLSPEQKIQVHDSFRQLIAQNRDGKIHALQISTESSIRSAQERSKNEVTGKLKAVAYDKIDQQTDALISMIGENKLRRLAEENKNANWLIMNGNRIQIKRKQFEKIIDTLDAI